MSESEIEFFVKFIKQSGKLHGDLIYHRVGKFGRDKLTYNTKTFKLKHYYYSWTNAMDIKYTVTLKTQTKEDLLVILEKHNKNLASIYIRIKKLEKIK